jgi:hypothetical protein
LAEKTGGQELMDRAILWDANSGEIEQERDRPKCIPRRVLNLQAQRHFEEGRIVQSLEFTSLDDIITLRMCVYP